MRSSTRERRASTSSTRTAWWAPPDRGAGASVGQLDDHRRVVAGALALALLAVDQRARRAGGEGGGAQDEVDPHALAPREAQAHVVPVRVDPGARRVRADDVGEA